MALARLTVKSGGPNRKRPRHRAAVLPALANYAINSFCLQVATSHAKRKLAVGKMPFGEFGSGSPSVASNQPEIQSGGLTTVPVLRRVVRETERRQVLLTGQTRDIDSGMRAN
jgi:hypothetical protein